MPTMSDSGTVPRTLATVIDKNWQLSIGTDRIAVNLFLSPEFSDTRRLPSPVRILVGSTFELDSVRPEAATRAYGLRALSMVRN